MKNLIRTRRGPSDRHGGVRAGIILLAVTSLLIGGSASRVDSAEQPLLTGVVMDPLGRALEGVRVLLVPDLPGPPYRTAVTGPGGRYELTGFLPGWYQILAGKPGFQVRLIKVDMVLRRSLDFTLFPAPLPGTSIRERGEEDPLKWVLRIPGGDILRSLEGPVRSGIVPVVQKEVGRSGSVRPAVYPLRGEFLHLEVGGMPFSRGDGSHLGSAGRQSRVRVDGGIGERMDWYLEGDLRRLTSFLAEGPSQPAEKEYRSRAVTVGMDFAPTGDDDISVSLLYGRSLLYRGEMFPDPFTPVTRQEQKAWGYDARWSRKIDDESRMNVNLRFQQGEVLLPDPGQDLLGRQLGGPAATVGHARWDAGGLYRIDLDDRHQLRVGLRTQVFRTGLRGEEEWLLIPFLAGEAGTEYSTPGGWDLDLFGEDQWKFSEPFRLIYGFTYFISDPLRDEQVLIPKVVFRHLLGNGTVWNAGLLVALNPGGDEISPVGGGEPEPATGMGYQLSLSHPLPQGFRVEVSATSHPAAGISSVLEGQEEYLTSLPSPDPDLFLAHRRVHKREFGVQVEKRFRHAVGRFGSTFGRAEGRLAAHLEDLAPLVPFKRGSMQYIATRLQTVLDRSDTEFRIGYRKVSEENRLDNDGPGNLRRYLVMDLMVAQRLAFLETLANSQWRVILAYQDVTTEFVPDPSGSPVPEPASTYSRLSGGVEIRF